MQIKKIFRITTKQGGKRKALRAEKNMETGTGERTITKIVAEKGMATMMGTGTVTRTSIIKTEERKIIG